jgi:hypothetical protein
VNFGGARQVRDMCGMIFPGRCFFGD